MKIETRIRIGYINDKALEKTIRRFYSYSIKRPIYLNITRALRVNIGLAYIQHVSDYVRSPKGMSVATFKDFAEDWFHVVMLNERCINQLKFHGYVMRDNEYGFDIFSKDQLDNHPKLCILFRFLAHELQHAKQKDKINSHNCSMDELTLQYKVNYNTKKLVPEWLINDPQEYDAEVAAMKNSRKLLEFYLDEIK
jgi:hypothetical protein